MRSSLSRKVIGFDILLVPMHPVARSATGTAPGHGVSRPPSALDAPFSRYSFVHCTYIFVHPAAQWPRNSRIIPRSLRSCRGPPCRLFLCQVMPASEAARHAADCSAAPYGARATSAWRCRGSPISPSRSAGLLPMRAGRVASYRSCAFSCRAPLALHDCGGQPSGLEQLAHSRHRERSKLAVREQCQEGRRQFLLAGRRRERNVQVIAFG